jgi:hypothetical protein
MHQQLWGYKVEWKSVSRGTGGKKAEYHCTRIPLVPVLSQMHPVHNFLNYFPNIQSNISLPSTPRSSELSLPFRFPQPKCRMYLSLMRATCPTYFILLDFITILYFVKRANYEASHYAIFSSLTSFRPSWAQIFCSAPCSDTLSLCSSLSLRDQVSHPYLMFRLTFSVSVEGIRFIKWPSYYPNPVSA